MNELRKKIAQMLIMGFNGCVIDDKNPVVSWLKTDGLGGVLLFDLELPANIPGKNLRTLDQIKKLTADLNLVSKMDDSSLPLIIAIDYEGGAVDRLANVPDSRKTIRPVEQAKLSDKDLYQEAFNMAVMIKSLGFNLNFAPVVDLALCNHQGIIGKLGRSFSTDPKQVIRAANLFVNAAHDCGVLTAYKHFPGHGSARGDTHEGCVDVTDEYHDSELEPYIALKSAAPSSLMVMTAHVINRQLDPSGLPATLSYPIITELLRNKIGFNGVVVSDDLQMQAISHHYSLEDSLCLTINAGADMVIFGNQLGFNTATEIIDCIEALVLANKISLSRINESFERILALKKNIMTLCP